MVASLQSTAQQVRSLQAAGKKVVFTNGCFDLLHSGHIDLLRRARALGDALVVAINSDASVVRLKGSKRPIISESERAELLDAFVSIHPDVLVKGADWTANIVGQKEVESWGGKVVALALVDGQSTTGIIDRVIARYGTPRKTH